VSAGKHSKRRKRRKAAVTAVDKMPALRQHWHRWSRFVLPLAVFCWPFLYLFRHVFPINGQYAAIGNDFILLYYKYKVYLLACLAELHLPLWSPAEGAGYPFYTNPFTQAFYPFNLLLVAWYKITGGYNPLDYQVFTVLGISIFALGLFTWLRLINTNLRAVVFATLVMSVSFKVTEMIRFPNAVHTAAWYPWILYALTRILLSKSLKNTLVGGVLLTLFLICFFTGGYPYYVYYGLFLFPPYLLVFLLKPLRLRLLGPELVRFKRALSTMILAGGAALALCVPYAIGIKRLMAETIDRAGKDFNYSTAHIFNFEDTLGSLVYPPAASVEGWYFFSIAGLLLIVLYMFTRKTVNNKSEGLDSRNLIPTARDRSDIRVKLFFIIWICIITYISYGRHSYLFKLLWDYMPGFSSLRVWGRLNIILVPILAWLLSLAYASFEATLSNEKASAPKKRWQPYLPVFIIAAVYTCILCVQIYFYHNNIHDRLWTIYFKHVSEHTTQFLVYGAAAFVVICSLLLFSKWIGFKSNQSLTAALAFLVLVAVVEIRHVGTRTWTYQRQTEKRRIGLDVAKINEASFRIPRTERNDTIRLGPDFSAGVLPNWYFGRYNKFLKETEGEPEARRTLLGIRDGRKIFFSKSIKHSTVQSFLLDAARYQPPGQLVSYTGDELVWEINAPIEGYLSFIDNWGRGWKVFINEKETEMELLFGTFKSVRITPGLHRVRFSYQPGLL
jgi:hypothetical protein